MKTIALGLFLLGSAATAPALEAPSPAASYVPCKIHQKMQATYPIRLLHEGILRGEATAVLEIDPSGRVTDRLIVGYTHREFADQMMRAIDSWTFEPGRVGDEPVISIFTVTFEYSVDGVVVYEKHFDANARDAWIEDHRAYFAHGPETLDHKPTAVKLTPPTYPQSWLEQGHTGSVTVRFYIDETGQARLPMIVAQSDDLLASAAVAAVRQWKFEPPLHHGKPVLAFAEQVFVFDGRPAPANKS